METSDLKKGITLLNPAAVVLILFLIFSLTMTVSLVSDRASFYGKAQNPYSGGALSLENSYVFASPLAAQANDREQIRITVFLLDTEGLGVAGRRVYLGQTPALRVKEIQPVSDALGKAIFDISSNRKGEYYIEVGVDGQVLPQTVRISFL